MLTPIVFADRVKDTSTTTGTGDFTLSGSAPTGFQTFDAALGHAGNYFYYVIDGGAEWEVGIGHLSASTTLVRDSILASSNSGSAVSFSAGTKNVFCDLAAAGIPQIAALSSDVTYNNTSTYANTVLNLPVLAGGVYRVEINIFGTENGKSPKLDLNGGSATMTSIRGLWRHNYSGSGGGVLFGSPTPITALSDSWTGSSNLTSAILDHFIGVITVNASGTFILRGAQNAAQASNTILYAGSNMILNRIG